MENPIRIDEWIGAVVPLGTEMRAEVLEMIVMFHTIKDRDIRHAIVSMLRSITKRGAPRAG